MRQLLVVFGVLWAVVAWGQETLNSEISIAGGNTGDIFRKKANGKSGFRSFASLLADINIANAQPNGQVLYGTGTGVTSSPSIEISNEKMSIGVNNFLSVAPSNSLSIGSSSQTYLDVSTQFSPVAGLWLQTNKDFAIAIHHSGVRVAGLVAYEGAANKLVFGKDMAGWGNIASYEFEGVVTSKKDGNGEGGQMLLEGFSNQNYRYSCDNYGVGDSRFRIIRENTSSGLNGVGLLDMYPDGKLSLFAYPNAPFLKTIGGIVTAGTGLNTSTNLTGDGFSTPLDLSNTSIAAGTYNSLTVDTKGRATAGTNTPYLPLTSTTPQTLNYGNNTLNINGQINLVNATTKLVAEYGDGELGYDDSAGVRNGLVFSDGNVHIRSTNGSNWAGIGVFNNGLPNVHYPGSTTANEGDALVLTNAASGEMKFGKTKKKISYPPITSTITITDEDVVLFHGANGNFNFGSTIYNLPNTLDFCGRTVSFINDWGYNSSSSFMKVNSTLSNIENVAGGGFTNSLNINFKAKLVCTCASGAVYWMQE